MNVRCLLASVVVVTGLSLASPLLGQTIWVEGEKPVKSTMTRHPWWYDQVQRSQLSGGDLISNWGNKAGEAEYRVDAPSAGRYEFWVRANPFQAKLFYKLNSGDWQPIELDKDAVDRINIAADRKPDIRFLAWVKVGQVSLLKGSNTVSFRMASKNNNHGYLDCFVFSTTPFHPRGKLKPEEIAAAVKAEALGQKDWFAFAPADDPFGPDSGIDLRWLNETVAGDGGFIGVKGHSFIHTGTGKPVRLWGVNGPPYRDRETLRHDARVLARRGVNLVRIHGGYFSADGDVDMAKVKHVHEIVEEMKAQGIYSHFSIYFPLWLKPAPNTAWLPGYDGKKHPFAALFFNQDFQKKYRNWWKALLTTPSAKTGKRLIDEPAVAGAEILNEDSYFFWTFNPDTIPDVEMRIIEGQFGDWLKKKYGSIEAAFARWGGKRVKRDDPAGGRVSFRPLWNAFTEKTTRDKDAARFLAESQRNFYRENYQFLRDLGFKGVITGSNWVTASPELFGPLEKYTYTICDFIDRHGYFGCGERGEGDGWSVRAGHTYADRSALRFDPEQPGKPRAFVHPVMDPHYDGKPSMVSETTFNRPNRYRSEAPLYYAAYGALQDSGAIVHFAFDTGRWEVKPGYFMQPWTLMSPAMMGQFPAAALVYRRGLIAAGDMLVDLNLKIQDLYDLKGTPLPQDASLDELRLKEVPEGKALKPGDVIDPLVHYAGRSNVRFTDKGGIATILPLTAFIDRPHKTVTSSTRELKLDYGKGVLTINAAAAQGVSGALRDAGAVVLKDITVDSKLELGHVIAVSLDGKPLSSSGKVLLQVMSEEQADGFRTEALGNGVKRIASIGHDPWMVRRLEGVVRFRRPDATRLKVTALDFNGYPVEQVGHAAEINLKPATLYYLITP